MPFLDTLVIAGHDIRALPYLKVRGAIDGIRSPLARRGDQGVPIPGRTGRIGVAVPIDWYPITIPVRIFGATRGERNDNLTTLMGLIGGVSTGGLVSLERRIATGSGESHLSHTAPGACNGGFAWTIMSPSNGKTALLYYQLKGFWSDDGGTTWTLP